MTKSWGGHEAGSSEFNRDLEQARANQPRGGSKPPKPPTPVFRWLYPDKAAKIDKARAEHFKAKRKKKGK